MDRTVATNDFLSVQPGRSGWAVWSGEAKIGGGKQKRMRRLLYAVLLPMLVALPGTTHAY